MRHGESLANGLLFLGPVVAAPAAALALTQPSAALLIVGLLLAFLLTNRWSARRCNREKEAFMEAMSERIGKA
jgi:Flp pilus assembly protein TadB